MKHVLLFLLLVVFTGKLSAQIVLTNGGIKITEVKESAAFDEATLALKAPSSFLLPKADTVHFDFEVSNYQLGNQTPDAGQKRCANSAKGQHIHFIVDNKPYEALYKPTTKTFLKEGKHLMIAFLSRSYHESIKASNAFLVKQITVGNTTEPDLDLTKPMLVYSRPKGIYIGQDTGRVLVDFYVLNTKLSAKGNRVRLTVNGNVFMLINWKPYLVEGLPMGESTIKLELVDKKGQVIPGPYNVVERKITLAAAEPLKK
jgi:hypothetical protein